MVWLKRIMGVLITPKGLLMTVSRASLSILSVMPSTTRSSMFLKDEKKLNDHTRLLYSFV